MTAPLLAVRNLTRRFGTRMAVQGVSFEVRAGEVIGLLGPNGAGKTTTLSLLAGLLAPDSGEVRIGGRAVAGDADPWKRRLGLVPQDLALYEELSAGDNLSFFGTLQGLHGGALRQAVESAIGLVGLADRFNDPVKTFSGGMKRRLNLAVALVHDPDLLLLDEPTVGVDPQSRNALFDNITALRGRGKTILYTTHYMEEVERLCDRVVVMDHGRVIADDTLSGLKRRTTRSAQVVCELDRPPDAGILRGLRALEGIAGVKTDGNRLHLQLPALYPGLVSALELLQTVGTTVERVESSEPSLEDVFLELTGRSLRDP